MVAEAFCCNLLFLGALEHNLRPQLSLWSHVPKIREQLACEYAERSRGANGNRLEIVLFECLVPYHSIVGRFFDSRQRYVQVLCGVPRNAAANGFK